MRSINLAPRPARAWPPAYRRPAMAAELHGGWAEVFAALLEGRWAPRFLDAGQLVRHALSLTTLEGRPEPHLVLLFWEPADGDALPEVLAHREEVAELVLRLGEAPSPQLHVLTYAELLRAWAPVRPEHVAALRARYNVAVGAASSVGPPPEVGWTSTALGESRKGRTIPQVGGRPAGADRSDWVERPSSPA